MSLYDGSTIAADGSFEIPTHPGHKYVLGISGTFGGGTTTLQWLDQDGNAVAYTGGSATAAGQFEFVAQSNWVRVVLAGATDPALKLLVVRRGDLARGSPGEMILAELGGTNPIDGRIGNEYLPEVLEVQGVQLADTSAVVLPAGTLGLDAAGGLVIHDGTGSPLAGTTGGIRYNPPNPYRIKAFLDSLTSDWSVAQKAVVGGVEIEIGRIAMTAAQCAAGKRLLVRGVVTGSFKDAKLDFIGLVMAFGETANGVNGIAYTLDQTVDFYRVDMFDNLILTEVGGALGIEEGVGNTNHGSVQFTKTGANAIAMSLVSPSSGVASGVPGVAQDLVVYAFYVTNAAGPSAQLKVDLEIMLVD